VSRTTSQGEGTVRQLCGVLGIARQAYYAAARGHEPRPRDPLAERDGPWVSTARIVSAIQDVVRDRPAWGIRMVWASLRRRGLVVSRNRVARLMKALGLVFPPPGEREVGAPRGHVATPDSNRRLATDLTTVWTRQDGLVAVVPVVDCGDRYALALDATKPQDAPAILAPVVTALEQSYGAPDAVPDGLELRTDHGPQYTGVDCERLCDAWHLDHTLAPVGRPTGNAIAERFILTLKIELLWSRDWTSLAELRSALAIWRNTYNHERPHQALDYDTPAERRARNLGASVELAA